VTLHEGDIPGLSANGARFLNNLADELNQFRTGFTQFITDYNAHTHSGVTTGAGASGAPSASTTATAPSDIDNADQTL
jgi:hypothetical protein